MRALAKAHCTQNAGMALYASFTCVRALASLLSTLRYAMIGTAVTVDHTPSRPGSSIFTPVALRSKIGLSIRRSALARTVRFVSLFVASDTPTGHLALWNFGRYPSSCRAQSLCRTCARRLRKLSQTGMSVLRPSRSTMASSRLSISGSNTTPGWT